MNSDHIKLLREKIVGLDISIECEIAVCVALAKYDDEWKAARETPEMPVELNRRMRQLLESRSLVKTMQEERAALEAVVAAMEVMT